MIVLSIKKQSSLVAKLTASRDDCFLFERINQASSLECFQFVRLFQLRI